MTQPSSQRPESASDSTTQEAAAAADDTRAADAQQRNDKLGEDIDAILDEIDEVLETNAEDFVRAFVQKGGE